MLAQLPRSTSSLRCPFDPDQAYLRRESALRSPHPLRAGLIISMGSRSFCGRFFLIGMKRLVKCVRHTDSFVVQSRSYSTGFVCTTSSIFLSFHRRGELLKVIGYNVPVVGLRKAAVLYLVKEATSIVRNLLMLSAIVLKSEKMVSNSQVRMPSYGTQVTIQTESEHQMDKLRRTEENENRSVLDLLADSYDSLVQISENKGPFDDIIGTGKGPWHCLEHLFLKEQ